MKCTKEYECAQVLNVVIVILAIWLTKVNHTHLKYKIYKFLQIKCKGCYDLMTIGDTI